MTDAHQGKTSPDHDQPIDETADAYSQNDPPTPTRLIAREHPAVPADTAG